MRRLIESSMSPIRRGLSLSMPKLAHSSSALLRTSSKNKSRLWTGLSGTDISTVLPDKGERLRQPSVQLSESCGKAAAAVLSSSCWRHMR